MAQKLDLKKILGIEQPDPFQGLLLPENMAPHTEDPWAQFAANYGARPSTPSREPAAEKPLSNAEILARQKAIQEEAMKSAAAFQQQAAGEIPQVGAETTQVESGAPQEVESGAPQEPDWATLGAMSQANALATADEMTPEVEAQKADLAAYQSQQPAYVPSTAEDTDEEGMTFEKYMDNLRNSANKADISPWAALIDRYTGGKLAENERATHKAKSENSLAMQTLAKDFLQEKRIKALTARDFAKDVKDTMKPYYDAQVAGKELLDAFTPEAEGENKGKISVGRVYGILNKLIAIGGGKGTQTEGDIGRVWQPFLDTLVARAKAFFGNREWGYISRDRVEDLIQLANSAAKRVSENADLRLQDIVDHYERRGLSNSKDLITPYSERVKQVVIIPDQKAMAAQAATGDPAAQAAVQATAVAPKDTGNKMKSREELEFEKTAAQAEQKRKTTPAKVKK